MNTSNTHPKKSSLIACLIFAFLATVTSLASLPSYAEPPAAAIEHSVNINTATAAELAEAISGVGLKKAEAIVAYRELHGGFSSLDELTEVKGLGVGTVEKNRAKLTL